ncbi:hypothetical protein [Arthrobacter sp. ISL-30]|uniref:sunset domain-containing protein n=1 Tax=Arthrobacter sp. ISL-30 TaxID=2819109 RepID=UPI001BE66522|nr:hypothetical protein [Arthrobacter sp. ISL-30]MBT2514023.1 hypothetical protein [Arthrobacter sp. ISL-30]
MDWVIWVIVIVLIIAIVWWLMSRGSTQSGAASPRGAASQGAAAERTAAPADSFGTIPGQAPPSVGGGIAASAAAAGTAGLTGLAGASAAAAAQEAGPGKSEDDEEAAMEQRTAIAEPSPTELGEEPPTVDDTPRPEDTFIAGQVAAADDPAARTAASAPGAGEGAGETDAGGVDVDDWDTETSGPSTDVGSGTAGTGSEATVDETTAPGVTADDVVPADPGPGGASASPENEMADRAEWEATWSEDSSTPTHHHDYTGPHTPTLPGAESAAAEAAEAAPAADDIFPEGSGGGHLAAENPYGEGSAAPAPDGSGPEGYVVKGDAESMTYHDEETPGYEDAKAGVWFLSAAHAEAAGFRPPRRNRL